MIILAAMLIAFLVTFFTTPIIIRKMVAHKITGVDVHKITKPVCAEMGGVAILIGFSAGFLLILFLVSDVSLVMVFAFLTVLFVGLVGMLDDLFNLRQRNKAILVALAGLPLALVNTEFSRIWFPYIGWIQLGQFLWLLIPLGVTTASNLTNMLAGFNGLEAGIGTISCASLGILCSILGRWNVASIAFMASAAFAAFLRYNWYPARIFPGDTGTLITGAAVASIAILGQVEIAAIIMMIPAAIDFFLKMVAKSHFSHRKIYGDTRVMNDGTFMPPPYPALAHAFMKVERLKEKELVLALLYMQAAYCVLGIMFMLLAT